MPLIAGMMSAPGGADIGQRIGHGLLGMQGMQQQRQAQQMQQMQMQQMVQKYQQEMAQRQQREQAIASLPPELQALAKASPGILDEYAKQMLGPGPGKRYEMTDRGPFDTFTGQVLGGTQQGGGFMQHPNYKGFASEYDLSKYQPESVKAAVEAGDPGMLKERLGFGDVMNQRERFEKQLSPLRSAAQASQQIGMLVSQKGPFADVATVYSLVKTLDPESVVREGEVSLMQSAMPLFDRLQTYVNKIQDGGLIGDALRKDIIETMNKLNGIYSKNYDKLKGTITGIAGEYGVKPEMWLGSPVEFSPLQYDPLGIR
jgi:hypothetical protein